MSEGAETGAFRNLTDAEVDAAVTRGPRLGLSDRLWLRWWAFKAWFHRCPECDHRPDKHHGSAGPRWEDDKIARLLGIGQYGCRRCGHGAIEERDSRVSPPEPPAPAEASEVEGGDRG